MDKKITFKMVSSITLYPDKQLVIDELKQNGYASVELVKENGQITVNFGQKPVGHIDKNYPDGTPYAEIESLVNPKRIAKLQMGQTVTIITGYFNVDSSEFNTPAEAESLKEICDKVVAQGLLTQEEVDERLRYARQYGVTERQIKKIFLRMRRYPDDVEKRIPVKPKTLYIDGSGILLRTVGYILSKRNMMFTGDRGVGKNVLIETLAWLFRRPLYEESLNSGHDNNSLLGGKTFDDQSEEPPEESIGFFKGLCSVFKNGFKSLFKTDADDSQALLVVGIIKKVASWFSGSKKIKFDPDIIVQAAMYGGFLVLDEFNTIPGHIMSMFNSLLDDRRRIQVPGYKLVVADEDFLAIATQNSGYQSTFQNNEATEDRFVPVEFPQLNSIRELLLAKVKGIDYDIVDKCDTLFMSIKKCVMDGEFPEQTMTVRGFIDACNASLEDVPIELALIDCVANKAQEKLHKDAIKQTINDLF